MIQHKYTLPFLPFLLYLTFTLLSIPLSVVAQISPEEKQNMNRPYGVMIEAYKQLDAEIVKQAYVDSAYYLSPTRSAKVQLGVDSIIADFASLFEKHRAAENEIALSFKILQREHSGNIAVDVGYYKISVMQSNGIERTSFGKFMKLLKRSSETAPWKFAADAFSFAPPVGGWGMDHGR